MTSGNQLSFCYKDEFEYQHLTKHDIHPLLAFRNLRHLFIDSGYCFNLHNSDIEDLARKWPHLKFLKFCKAQGEDLDSYTMLNCIGAFATHCPNLQDLALNISITAASRIPALPSRHESALTTLGLHGYHSDAEFLPRMWSHI